MTAARPHPALAEVLAYRHPDVVARFLEAWDVEPALADALFEDLMRWLWACTHPAAPSMGVTDALYLLDEMWHTFVLFTVDYAAFGARYFARYLHHQPTTLAERAASQAAFTADPGRWRAEQAERDRAQYQFIAAQLGDDVLIRWYVDFPLRFDAGFLATRRRPPRSPWQPSETARRLAAALRDDRSPSPVLP